MKKFLSFHGLGILLSAVVLSSLLTTGIWWKILIIGLVFIFQAVLESFEVFSYLRWNRERDYFSTLEQDGEFAKEIWFSVVKTLSAFLITMYAQYYGNGLTAIPSISVSIFFIISVVLYYGKNIFPDTEKEKDIVKKELTQTGKRIIAIFLILFAICIACLNFGTWYVWLSSFLALIFLSGLMVNDLVGEIKHERKKTKKIVIIISSILPFLISIVSTIYQFWSNIWNSADAFWIWILDASEPFCNAIVDFLTYRISEFSVWFILLAVILGMVSVKIFRDILTQRANDKERAIQQAQAEKEEAEAKELREINLKMIIYSLANDKPINKEYLVYLAKNQDYLEGFPLKKLACFNLEKMLTISMVKQKIVWEHDLECILKMYNSWFKKAETSDEILLLLTKSIVTLYNSIKEHKEYQSFNAFEKMLKDTAPNILATVGIS